MSHLVRLFKLRQATSRRIEVLAEVENLSRLLTDAVVELAITDLSDVHGADRAYMQLSEGTIAVAEATALLQHRMEGRVS